jgi:hypothetical protein
LEPIDSLAGVHGSAPSWLLASTSALSVVGLLLSLSVLVLTARGVEVRHLGLLRWSCPVFMALLVSATFVGGVTRWALALSSIGFLLGLQALALRLGVPKPLRAYLERGTPQGDPGWWSEFEREMRSYTRGGRDNNPLQRAVSRDVDASESDEEDLE